MPLTKRGAAAIIDRIIGRLSRKPRRLDYALAFGLPGGAVLCHTVLEGLSPGIPYLVMLIPTVAVTGVFCGTLPAIFAGAACDILVEAPGLGRPLLAGTPFNAAQTGLLTSLPACAIVLGAISILRRAAINASEAEARLAEVFRQIPGAAAIIEPPDGRLLLLTTNSDLILDQSDRAFKRTGDINAYGGLRADGTRLAADDHPIVRALKTGEVVWGERLRHRRADGQLIDLEIYAGPVRSHDGEIRAAVGMAFDVTVRAEAERLLREREEALRQALDARDVLMREADHRIKNSLLLTSSLLRLQIAQTGDTNLKDALLSAVARVEAIGGAHRALQHSPDLKLMDIDMLLEELCGRLGSLNPAVIVRCAARVGLLLDADKAISLGLIANELLTNALRHAFPPGTHGVVTLTSVADDGLLRMTIADGGTGLAVSPRRPGLGTDVVVGLAKQIGAALSTQSEPGQGTTVSVSMPLRMVFERQSSPATAIENDLA
jgi:two-component sensor histidine kinase